MQPALMLYRILLLLFCFGKVCTSISHFAAMAILDLVNISEVEEVQWAWMVSMKYLTMTMLRV